ncbi:MAG: hypothetical protein PHY48_08415 [Candidatus Cloacimonetes bacterium]|nr:hypothetical protein [Candidatus Cloacimonadota bacterium]
MKIRIVSMPPERSSTPATRITTERSKAAWVQFLGHFPEKSANAIAENVMGLGIILL